MLGSGGVPRVDRSRREVLGALLRGLTLLAAGGLGAKTLGCSRPARGGDMADFNAVQLGAHVRTECTPEVPKDFVGLRIAAPASVQLGKDKFAVCGTYRFPAEYLHKFPECTRAIVLVAVDARTHQPYANNLVPLGATVVDEAGPPPKDPEWMENHFIQMYFNVDLRRYLELPRADADYWIYALLEDHVSNVVRVAFRV